MDATSLVAVAAAVFLWGVVSARWERADLSAPMVFTAVGAALAAGDLVDPSAAVQTLKPLVEVTLVWVLFSDAARVPVHDLRGDATGCLRLLAVGLPLTVLAGWGLAGWGFPRGSGWRAGVGGAGRPPPPPA